MQSEYRIGKHRGKLALIHGSGEGRKRISLGTSDRGAAEAIARDIWRRLHAAPSERVEDLWPAYVRDRKQSVARTDRFDSIWTALKPHFGHRLGKAINQDDCRDYIKARRKQKKADSTIKTELEFLRACLRFHYGDQAPKLHLPPASAPRANWLTKEEAETLLAAIEAPHVKLFVELALATGARMSAILDLTWDRVDLESATPTINFQPAGRHQTNKRRTVVPITPRALAKIKEAQEAALTDHVIEYAGQPVKSIKKAIRSAAARAKVSCSPHVFRHTAGVWMAQANIPMQKIAQFLGHTSTRVTEQVYARYSPSFMADASAALNF